MKRQIENLLVRIEESSNKTVIHEKERRLEQLEMDRHVLSDKLRSVVPTAGEFDEAIELSLKFLSSLWDVYEDAPLNLKRLVLRRAFLEPIRYSRESGCRTANLSFPFKGFQGMQCGECRLVGDERLELPTSSV